MVSVRKKQSVDASSEDEISMKRGAEFQTWVSRSLDVFKGIFIIFMLAEHTRSSFGIDMTSKEPIMQFVSQVACSLDMTSFSTAYGFSCYQAYLTNSKNRSSRDQFWRVFRSVGLIVSAMWMCNIIFALGVLRWVPTWTNMRKIFTMEVLFWDFLATFPAMLLMGFLITKPLMHVAVRSGLFVRLCVFAILLGLPLLSPQFALEACSTLPERYSAVFLGCVKRAMGAMRFSAGTYMFFFNLGCIVSMYVSEYRTGPSLQMLRKPHWVAFLTFFAIEFAYALPLLHEYNSPWEYLNWNGYRRFPMTAPLMLAWGFLSQSVAIGALCLTYCERKLKFLRPIVSMLEHFGANVLLYLTVSNFVINSIFHVEWEQYQESAKQPVGGKVLSIRTWEFIVLAAAVGQILLVLLLRYMIQTSRK